MNQSKRVEETYAEPVQSHIRSNVSDYKNETPDFFNERRTVVSKLINKLHSIEECKVRSIVEKLGHNEKNVIHTLCCRICSNLDDVE
jgi:hypothetical protein